MTIYAEFDSFGLPKGFYDTDVVTYSSIPSTAVVITKAERAELASAAGAKGYIGGKVQVLPDVPYTASALSVPADGATVLSLSGLPSPTDVVVSGPVKTSATTSTGVIDLVFHQAGAYSVTLSSYGYTPVQVSINAT